MLVFGTLDISSSGILNLNNISGAGVSTPTAGNTSLFYDTDTDLISYVNTTTSGVIGIDPADTINGIRHYGALAADPVSPAPSAGDMYYNTVLNQEMRYDASRSKWLSVAVLFEGCGRNGTTGANAFYQKFNGIITALTYGPIVPRGTIVSIGYGSQNAVAHTFEVLVNGVVVASLASGGSNAVYDDTFNVDIDEGLMSFRNAAGSGTTTNLQATVQYKLRI
jgi:hypothetical protein